ncbi:DOT1-domain-containing protein [Pholiota conissans]|uniref:Histone-lysine N-methyltransferase, H3 lysine-79 specific n=1 Tax=Pholiota conissans TaxID=109636 RepID=A0A9P5Z0G9_9AGAR|nr:DOT1-domain-containing protein [Pholiota conissans]
MTMLSTPPTRSATDLGFFSASKISQPGASTASSVHVTTRISRPPVQPTQRSGSVTPSQSVPNSSSPPSSLGSSHSSDGPKKRKSIPSEPSAGLPREVKRLRASSSYKQKTPKRKASASSKNSSRAASRQNSLPPSPEPIYRSSRSRSTSMFPTSETEAPKVKRNRRWFTDEDGSPGEDYLSSEKVVRRLMKSYKAFFKNPNDDKDKTFEPDPVNPPMVDLEYPNSGAIESFILLAPKDKDHYNPIMDLERSLYTIVECYVPREHQKIFGPIPTATLSDVESPPPSPSPSPPCSSSSSISSRCSQSSEDSSLTSLSSSSPMPAEPPLLRTVQRAIHLQDGPLFLAAMKKVNKALHDLKYPAIPADPFLPMPRNPLMATVESWTDSDEGLPEKVLMRIIEENYQRTVGPNIPSLRQYEAFSSTVYGELMPSLSYEMINITGLNEDSLFLDLGSGVGNIVTQASLQTGCKSYGIELMPHPARVARDMVAQMKVRCRMWGVRVGDMELEEGDMLRSKRVDELIAKADVVLVDNKVFEQSLNEALRPKFLDLKEGATVISLSPFVSSINARLTKRNVDDISAIFEVTERPYHSGSVSWGNNGGNYYLHKVDREGYAKIKEKFELTHTRARSTRSRK